MDPGNFCRHHPEFGEELRSRIEDSDRVPAHVPSGRVF
jgi:hypothetical protein